MIASSERQLLQSIGQGDRGALEILLYETFQPLLRYVESKVPKWLLHSCAPEDIVQETHLRVLRNIGKFRGNTLQSFQLWLRAIAENQIIDEMRASTRQKRGGEYRRVHADGFNWPAPNSVAPKCDTREPSTLLSQAETRTAINDLIAALPASQQRAIRLHFLHGLSVAETAKALNRSLGATRGLLRRAKTRLRSRVSPVS